MGATFGAAEYQPNGRDGLQVGVGGNCRVLPLARPFAGWEMAGLGCCSRWLAGCCMWGPLRIQYFFAWWARPIVGVRAVVEGAALAALAGVFWLVMRASRPGWCGEVAPRLLHAAGVVLYRGCAGGWRAWGWGEGATRCGWRWRAHGAAGLILRARWSGI